MKFITKLMDGSPVVCDRCGNRPGGVWVFKNLSVCDKCILPDELYTFGGRDDDPRVKEYLKQKHMYSD